MTEREKLEKWLYVQSGAYLCRDFSEDISNIEFSCFNRIQVRGIKEIAEILDAETYEKVICAGTEGERTHICLNWNSVVFFELKEE